MRKRTKVSHVKVSHEGKKKGSVYARLKIAHGLTLTMES